MNVPLTVDLSEAGINCSKAILKFNWISDNSILRILSKILMIPYVKISFNYPALDHLLLWSHGKQQQHDTHIRSILCYMGQKRLGAYTDLKDSTRNEFFGCSRLEYFPVYN